MVNCFAPVEIHLTLGAFAGKRPKREIDATMAEPRNWKSDVTLHYAVRPWEPMNGYCTAFQNACYLQKCTLIIGDVFEYLIAETEIKVMIWERKTIFLGIHHVKTLSHVRRNGIERIPMMRDINTEGVVAESAKSRHGHSLATSKIKYSSTARN